MWECMVARKSVNASRQTLAFWLEYLEEKTWEPDYKEIQVFSSSSFFLPFALGCDREKKGRRKLWYKVCETFSYILFSHSLLCPKNSSSHREFWSNLDRNNHEETFLKNSLCEEKWLLVENESKILEVRGLKRKVP